MQEFHAYIDEAGNEGFGKLKIDAHVSGQSKWLLLGAVIVSRDNDKLLPQWRDGILDLFPNRRVRDLHFKHLNHDQRVASCNFISDKQFGVAVVCSDKRTISLLKPSLLAKYKEKGHLYNYLVRFLLERLTLACRARASGQQVKLHITFSRRGGTDYSAMRDYLFLLRDGREKLQPVRSIDWQVLNPEDIRVEDHASRAGLQLADLVTSATFMALEPNSYGDTESRYVGILGRRYIRVDNKVADQGITFVPKSSANLMHCKALLEIARKARAPGS